MRVPRFHPAIPLFDRFRDHSSVPIKICKAAARSGGPGRPNGRREAALPWTGASKAAWLVRSGAFVWVVALLLFVLTICDGVALATEQSATQSVNDHAANVFAGFVAEASRRFAVPVRWINSVIRLESTGDARAKSPKGAMGLMQIMPETWADLRLRYELGNDPYDARDNILAGTAYLAELRDRYGVPGAFAAYNAGPARYEGHLAGEPLPAGTRAYVANLATLVGVEFTSSRIAGQFSWTVAPLFVPQSERRSIPDWQQARSLANGAIASSDVRGLQSIMPSGTSLFIARSDAGGAR